MDDGIGTSNNSDAEGDEEYFATMPPGNKFDPNDRQIVVDYLMPRIKGQLLPRNKIREVNLYKYNPEDLTALYKKGEDKAWFFLTSRDRKYANGNRPNTAAGIDKLGEGYWKPTGSLQTMYDKDGNEVGKRRALIFYRRKPRKGTKTDWRTHEFTANCDNYNSERVKDKNADKMRLDDWVVCKVYQKPNKGSKGRPCAVKDNQVKTEESASPPATNVNDSSAVLEFNFSSESMEPYDEQFLNDIQIPFGYNSGHGSHQNPMTTNVDNHSSNHHLHLDAAPQSSLHPSLSLIDPTSLSPGNDFGYNKNSSMAYSDDSAGWHWENIDPNVFDKLTPMVHTPLIIRENPPIHNGDNNGEGHSSSGQGWTYTDKGKKPLIDNNGEGPSSSGQGWTHSEVGNRPYIHNNGEGSSRQGWMHTEDGNRPYDIDNNGGGHRSSGQGWTHAQDGNRPYHIYNNGEGSSGQGTTPR